MLSKRFRNDGKPVLSLNELQRDMKKQIEDKIAQGIYSFEKVPCCVCGGDDFELLSEKDRYALAPVFYLLTAKITPTWIYFATCSSYFQR